MCDDQHSNRMPAVDDTHQLMDSCEIKQEPNIKEEPQPTGDLEEFPALNNRDNEQSIIDFSQLTRRDNSIDSSINEVKIEVKKESDKTNEKSSPSNSSNANEAAIGNLHAQRLSKCDALGQSNRKNKTGRNAKNSNNRNVQGRTLKQHQCEQCEYATMNKSDLKRHSLKHTGETPFKCCHCAKAFKSTRSLKNHMKVHVEDFLFSCAICLKGFDQKNEKMEHEINCKSLRYECHLCKKSIRLKKSHLINHMLIHSGKKLFECMECWKQFTQKSHLNRHMKLHDGPRSFRCSNCREGFSQEKEMIAHQQKCNRPAYECYVCGKTFGSHRTNLNKHMRTHTGDKPFKCNQCLKKFTQKSSLNLHIKLHSRSLSWKCAICRQGFAKQTQSKVHQRNCRRRVYECFDCKKFFGSQCTNLRGHMNKHSGEKPFRCEVCGNRFTFKSSLTKHIKSIHM